MVDTAVLNEVVIDSFRKNALRSVLFIDERFPKHNQVGTDAFSSPDAEVCKRLYEAFNTRGLLCDVENDVESAKNSVSEQVRKSDLLVLDLHLNKDAPTDSEDSIKILQTLADSDQFNLVIVYTNEKQLTQVARQLAGSLRGSVPDIEDDDVRDSLDAAIAELKESLGSIPYEECIDFYLIQGSEPGNEVVQVRKQFPRHLEKPLLPYTDHIVHRFAEQCLREDYGALPQQDVSRTIEAGRLSGTNPWFVSGSLFVVIANKQESPPENGVLLDVLDRALTEWNPGVVRCLLSEIHNCIGKSGYPFRSTVAKDAVTQVGWLYHAVQELSKGEQHGRRIVSQLTSQVMGLLRERVSDESSLVEMSMTSLKAIEVKQDPQERIAELKVANGIPVQRTIPFPDVLHALNAFLSSESFGPRAYVTTGTVLKEISNADEGDSGQWWLCVQPSCETVPEQAGDDRFIRLKLLKLHRKTNLAPLENATRSRFIFVEYNNERIYLDTRVGKRDTHELSEVYVSRDNQIAWESDRPIVRFWRTVASTDPLTITEGCFIPVSQLRDANASRFLQEAGHHQSRIGVDFVECTKEDILALNKPRGKNK